MPDPILASASCEDALDSTAYALVGFWKEAIVAQQNKPGTIEVVDVPQVAGSGVLMEPDNEDVAGVSLNECAFVCFGQQPDVRVPILKSLPFQKRLLNILERRLPQS